MDVSGQIYTLNASPLGKKELPVTIERESGWATELIWTFWRR